MKSRHDYLNELQDALEDELIKSMENVNSTELQMIKELKSFSEQKCYKTYTRDASQYLEYLLHGAPRDQFLNDDIQQVMQNKLESVGQSFTEQNFAIKPKHLITKAQIQNTMKRRQMIKIKSEKQALQHQIIQINKNIELAREQQQSADNGSQLMKNMSQAEKQAEVKRFLMQKHKQSFQRKKKIEQVENKLAQTQLEKLELEKRHHEEMAQLKKQQIADRLKKSEEQRALKMKLREQHQAQFSKLRSQSTNTQIPADLKKLQEEEIRQKLLTRKQKLDLSPLDFAKLQAHSRRYEEFRQLESKRRRQRLKIQQSLLSEQAKHYSSYQSRNGAFKHEDKIEVEDPKQPLRDKLRRVKDYYAIIRDKFKPIVDKKKQRDLMNQIEEMQLGGRHIKRSKLENGSVLIQQMPKTDPKVLGIQYLQYVKKLTKRDARSARRSFQSCTPVPQKEAHHRIDYLSQMKTLNKRKVQFPEQLEKHSYDERVKMVQHKADIMMEDAKRKEAILKHGKFLSPEQMLQYKEDLDEQYLEIINLKLKLIS